MEMDILEPIKILQTVAWQSFLKHYILIFDREHLKASNFHSQDTIFRPLNTRSLFPSILSFVFVKLWTLSVWFMRFLLNLAFGTLFTISCSLLNEQIVMNSDYLKVCLWCYWPDHWSSARLDICVIVFRILSSWTESFHGCAK